MLIPTQVYQILKQFLKAFDKEYSDFSYFSYFYAIKNINNKITIILHSHNYILKIIN